MLFHDGYIYLIFNFIRTALSITRILPINMQLFIITEQKFC